MHTNGWLTQGKPNTDAEIFMSAVDAFIVAGAGIVQAAIGTTGLAGMKVPASTTAVFELFPSALLLRTGILQSNNFATNTSQQAFGTANGPGPSSVAGTSGPSGFGPNSVIPPVLASNLPTLKGSTAGAAGKGIQINWLDFLYQVGTLAATSITVQAFKNAIPVPGADLSITQTALTASTGLSTVVNSTANKIHRQRVNVTTPAMLTDDCDIVSISTGIVTPATSTVTLIGVVLGCSYNFN